MSDPFPANWSPIEMVQAATIGAMVLWGTVALVVDGRGLLYAGMGIGVGLVVFSGAVSYYWARRRDGGR